LVDNKVVTKQDKIAEAFNEYFLSVADSVISDINGQSSTSIINPITYLINVFNKPFDKMSWQYATTHEVEKIIRSLKTKDSYGYDKISSRILKSSVPFIISPVTYICKRYCGLVFLQID
jgi:hypothetical protein